ncbi:MAG: Ldh family oxidoreductase [Bryobacteraceae bacterium]
MTGFTFRVKRLHEFVEALTRGVGASDRAARIMAESLVAASARGVDSHGMQLLPFYLAQLDDGRVDPKAEGRVVSESGAIAVFDGCNALGQVVADTCCDLAAKLAGAHGMGLVVARESNHFGAAGWWGQKIAGCGYIAMVLCNASSMVSPWQGRDPRWGTNPICVAVPGGGWMLDMATTTVAMGRVYKAGIAKEETIPAGWAMDSEGAPTTLTAEALKGMLMPLGGYKGSGLAFLVELLTGGLSGGAMSTELGGLRVKDRPFRVSQFFLAIDPERIMPAAEFEERKQKLIRMAKSSRPARGYDEVLVAGEPEWRSEAERLKTGIPVEANLWGQLVEWAGRLGVAVPDREG